jgi:peptidoglycan hydrolase-like protein with peptidoglycan-binding domain
VSITQNLSIGASGQNVIALQTFLIAKGFLTMSPGTSEGYFGNLTKQALVAYQKSVGLPATGYCGSMTRSAISAGQ